MAVAPVNKFISLAVPVAPGEQKLYEVPTGTSSLVLYAQVANVGIGTYPSVTFIQRRQTRSTGNTRDVRVIKDVEIPPNDAVILIDGRMVLEKTPLIIDSLYVSGTQTGVTTIYDVLYNEPTGVVTVTTMDPHGFSSGSEITMAGIAFTCPPKTGITTTIFPSPQASYVVDTIVDTVGTSKTFTSIVGSAVGYEHTYNPAIHKFVKARNEAITFDPGGTPVKYTPRGGNYDSKTGILTLDIPCHAMLDATSTNAKDVGAGTTYNAAVGILTVTSASHGFANGDLVRFDDDALKFRCSLDNYTGIHTYPRISDPSRGVWLEISNKTTDTFEVNVGKSTFSYFDVSAADYDGVAGIVTCNIGSHSLTAGTNIRLATESLGFICEAGAGTKYYPRSSGTGNPGGGPDPGFSTSVTITAVDTNTVSLDVGKITSVSNTGVHTFVAATPKTITDAEYDPIVGIMTATIAGHGMYDGDAIKIDTNSISFSCDYCGAAGVSSIKSYPRTKDPIVDTFVAIGNTTVNTFEVNVGSAGGNTSKHTFKSATSGGVTRAVITSGGNYNHRFDSAVSGSMRHSNKKISITNNSLYFTCSMDNFSTEHSYPRATDPVSGISTAITRADYNTISAFVGVNTAGGLVAPLQMEFLASILENSNA